MWGGEFLRTREEVASFDRVAHLCTFLLKGGAPLTVDWQPMIESIITDLRRGEPVGVIAARFHNTLAEVIAAVAREVGESRVVLSGGYRVARTSASSIRRSTA